MSPEDFELLQRHAPLLLLDRLERFSPVAIVPFLAVSAVALGTRLLGAPPADLGATASAGPAGLHLDPTWGVAPASRGRALFAHFAPPPGPPEWRCYGEIEPLTGGGRALGYWFFWVDNPFGIRFTDIGRHVGDWEQVLIELAPDGTVVAVTVMQHGSAHRVPAGAPSLVLDDGRPHVYVAEGSHAAYLTAGAQPRKLKQDNTSDGGHSGVPRVLPLPTGAAEWARWPGRWGPDTGAVLPLPGWLVALARRFAPNGFGGDSPPGPLARGAARGATPTRAHTPGRFAPNAWLSRILQVLGNATWPRRVALDRDAGVAFADRVVRAEARVGGILLRRARYLDALAVDADGAALGHARVRVRGGSTALAVQLAVPGTPAELRLAGYNALDQRSDVDAAPITGS